MQLLLPPLKPPHLKNPESLARIYGKVVHLQITAAFVCVALEALTLEQCPRLEEKTHRDEINFLKGKRNLFWLPSYRT